MWDYTERKGDEKMSHTPFGYHIQNGKAIIDEEAAEQIKALFEFYLSGDSLATAAKKADIKAFHSSIGRMLQNTRYLGDEYYPAIINSDIFEAVQVERAKRTEKLGRVYEKTEEFDVVYTTAFYINKGTEQFDDPFGQAEYAYSLIETEVQDK